MQNVKGVELKTLMKELRFSVGIQGSGKSTYFKDKNPVIETDGIRKELFSNVDNISQEKLIFDTALDRIVESFKENDIVYFDATMGETKHRVTFLKEIKDRVPGVELTGVIFKVDPEVAKKRIQNDIDSGADRASSIHLVDEYYEYWKETMELIKDKKVLFKPFINIE